MSKIIISRGDHRNEEVAYELASRVFEKLKAQGLDTELYTMYGLHSLVEELPDADDNKIKKFLETIYFSGLSHLTLDREGMDGDDKLFDFHNSPAKILNPGSLNPAKLPVRHVEQFHQDLKYNRYHGEDISWEHTNEIGKESMIAFYRSFLYLPLWGLTRHCDRFSIEIPSVYVPYPQEQQAHYRRFLKRARKLRPDMERSLTELTKNYLTKYADIPVNRDLGYLDEQVVSKLAALVKRLTIIHDS